VAVDRENHISFANTLREGLEGFAVHFHSTNQHAVINTELFLLPG
jgi:hypothetical protein